MQVAHSLVPHWRGGTIYGCRSMAGAISLLNAHMQDLCSYTHTRAHTNKRTHIFTCSGIEWFGWGLRSFLPLSVYTQVGIMTVCHTEKRTALDGELGVAGNRRDRHLYWELCSQQSVQVYFLALISLLPLLNTWAPYIHGRSIPGPPQPPPIPNSMVHKICGGWYLEQVLKSFRGPLRHPPPKLGTLHLWILIFGCRALG